MCVCFVERCCCLCFWAHPWSVVVLEPLPLCLSSFCVLRRADCVLTFSSWRTLSDCSAVTHPVPSSSARRESKASDWRVCYRAGSAAWCCLFPTIPRASRITGYENPSRSPGRLNPPTQVLQRRTKSSEYSVFSLSPASKSLSFLISSLRTSLCSLLTLPFQFTKLKGPLLSECTFPRSGSEISQKLEKICPRLPCVSFLYFFFLIKICDKEFSKTKSMWCHYRLIQISRQWQQP